MIRSSRAKYHLKERLVEETELPSKGPTMHRIEMSLVDHCESKGFPLVATQNGCSNWTARNQLLRRYEDKHGRGRLVSNGVHPWDDGVPHVGIRAFVNVLCLTRSMFLR